MSAYEIVAASLAVLPPDGDVLRIGWWAPEGSDWRPLRPRQDDELHIYLPEGKGPPA